VRNKGLVGGSADPVLDLLNPDSVLLTDDVHEDSRDTGRAAVAEVRLCWHLKHLKGC